MAYIKIIFIITFLQQYYYDIISFISYMSINLWSALKKIFFSKNEKCNNVKDSMDFSSDQEEIIDNEISVYDCIIPNKELCFVSIKSSFENLISQMEEKEASCAFIYDNHSDDLVGIVYEKDIIATLHHNKKDGCEFVFSDILFVPYVMNVFNAVETMNEKHTTTLVVVDNRGITLGIVTKASIIDFVYGYKSTIEYFKKNNHNNSITVDGSMLLKHIPKDWYINAFYDCYKTGTRTIGGFLGYHTGAVLSVGTEITVDHLKFKILEGDEKVIKTILITQLPLSNKTNNKN